MAETCGESSRLRVAILLGAKGETGEITTSGLRAEGDAL
jgi:hypothetical protein